ncbi:MAG TPA: alpha-L-rhamnosidase N-terminal domain-containing protein [Caulobacteraceae bacterium]
MFRKVFELAAPPVRAPFSITVDGRYQLFVNGQRVGRGPVRCSPLFQRYDDYDLGHQLHAGANAIAVLIHSLGVDAAFYETTKGLWQPTFGDGGLWTDGAVETPDGAISLAGDESWRCVQSDAWAGDTERSNHSLGFIEDLDGALAPENWTTPGFDDGAWDQARSMLAGGGGPQAPYGGMETRPFPILLPRGIPQLEERLVAARRVVWARAFASSPELPLHRRAYEEPFAELDDAAFSRPDDLLKLEGGEARIRTAPGRDVAVLLDFGAIMTGYPMIEVEGQGGEVIEIACAEGLPGEWSPGGPPSDARITRKPWLGHDAHICRYRLRVGRQRFERFEWCAIRWMQLVVRDAPHGVTVRGLGANITNYPVEERGRFQCSDALLTRLWSTGAYTLRQCMHDAWEDCPSREQRQWLGDVTVENLVGQTAFGPCVAPLTAKFLAQAAESQRPDGLTQMFAPGDHRTDGLLIPDWTLQWILCAADHWRYTGDLATVEAIFPSILKALAWFERQLDQNGLVADMPYWHFMDWAGVGREGEACALNAELAGAFRAAGLLARAVGWESAATRLSARADALGRALSARHWDERRGVFVDVVDPVTGAQQPQVSQHANAAMALWAAPDPARRRRALARITDSSRLTFTAAPPIAPEGEILDPEHGVVLANTFYSHFIYEALAEAGQFPTALTQMRERFGPMLEMGATTLWESFRPSASLCHGFSASPTYQLSRRMLGVAPARPGFAAIAVTPDLADLEYAEGAVPTAVGDVKVRLERGVEGFTAVIEAPTGVPVELAAAPGLVMSSFSGGRGAHEARFARVPIP